MDADGTDQTQLTEANTTGFSLYTPDWSPDGTKLVARSFGYVGFRYLHRVGHRYRVGHHRARLVLHLGADRVVHHRRPRQ